MNRKSVFAAVCGAFFTFLMGGAPISIDSSGAQEQQLKDLAVSVAAGI